MINAKKISILLEDYFTSKKILGNNVEVYRNPNSDDLKSDKTSLIL